MGTKKNKFEKMERLPIITPGQILLEEFMQPNGISQNALSIATGMPTSRVNKIIKGDRSITVETALRLSAFFNNNSEFWLNLQRDYDLECVERDGTAMQIKESVRTLKAAYN